jgi:hypothetical protein
MTHPIRHTPKEQPINTRRNKISSILTLLGNGHQKPGMYVNIFYTIQTEPIAFSGIVYCFIVLTSIYHRFYYKILTTLYACIY